jgi:hypothetical protein
MSGEVRYFRWTTAQRADLMSKLPIQLQVCEVRPHLQDGLVRYVVDGVLPGGFLQACLCVHLIEVARRGDGISLLSLPGVITFLEHYAPSACWGSRAKVLAWTTTPDRLEIPE